MPVDTDQFDVEISQSIGDKLVIATKDRIEVYTEPGGGNANRRMIHQQPVNYPGMLLKQHDRELFLQGQFTKVAEKVAAGKITEKKATLTEEEEELGGDA